MEPIYTTDLHTGGMPVRIVTSGYPEVKGDTILAKRRYAKSDLDHLRTFLMHEPRGHYDQYGALLVKPDHPEADIGVLFMHNDGYSTMCGHATIAVGRYVVDNKLNKQDVGVKNGKVATNIQCPCGLVKASVEVKDGVSGAVTFISVPAFACALDFTVKTSSYGNIKCDIGYGGAFYAFVDVHQVNLDVSNSPCTELVKFADEVCEAVKKQYTVKHPDGDELSFLYGAILTDGKDSYSEEPTRNLCVFGDKEVDRSPCGSGSTARLAVMYAKKCIQLQQERVTKNPKTGSKFYCKVVEETKCGHFEAIRVQVKGEAFYTGTSKFYAEPRDELKHGFLIR